jgi:hypothetical protein
MEDEDQEAADEPLTDHAEPGDRAPADRRPAAGPRPPADGGRSTDGTRRLARPPGERYSSGPPGQAGKAPASGAPRGAATAGVIGAMVGGALLVGVLGSFDLGPGMLVVAAFIGWVVALAVVWAMPVRPVRRRWLRPVVAALLAAGSIAAGLLVLWGWALVEGGVLGPVAYADARFGLLAPLLVLAAAAVAAVRAR